MDRFPFILSCRFIYILFNNLKDSMSKRFFSQRLDNYMAKPVSCNKHIEFLVVLQRITKIIV